MYKKYITLNGKIASEVLRLSDNAFIPMDEQNTDYQAYLKWVSEGNVPTPADDTPV